MSSGSILYDLIDLRARLRKALNVDQISIYAVAKGSGVPAKVLAQFLADGSLGDDQALYLHSYLYYEREDADAVVQKLVERSAPVGIDETIQAYERELRRYGVKWKLDRAWLYYTAPRRALLIQHMDERCKMEFLKLNSRIISNFRIVFHDGQSYWQWLKILRRYENRQEVKAWRIGSEAARRGYGNTPPEVTRARRGATRLRWRGKT